MDDVASIIAQQGEIQRRRQLLGAMQQQNMQSGIQGSGTGNVLGQAIAKIATAYLLGKNGNRLATQEADNRSAYSTALQDALMAHIDQREGKPGQVMTDQQAAALMENNVQPTLAEPVKGQPRRAAISAMASQFPELQAIGKTEYAGLGKEQINPLDYLKLEGYDPQSKVEAALGGGVKQLKGKDEYKELNGQLVKVSGGVPQKVGDYRDVYGPDERVNGEVVQRVAGTNKAHQVANRPPQTNVNVLPNAQKVGLEELFKKYAQNVSELGETARQAVKLQGALQQLGSLDASGTYTGPVADGAIWLNQLANAAGIPIDKNKLANSEAYNSTAAEASQRLVAQFGGNRNVTKEEAAIIQSITPQLANSPQARAQLTQILNAAAERSITNYKAAHDNYVKAAQTNDATQINPMLYNSQLPTTSPIAPQPGAGGSGVEVKNW